MLQAKKPYVMSNPRYKTLDPMGDDFHLTAPVHIHVYLLDFPFIHASSAVGLTAMIERGWTTEDKVEGMWYRIYRTYDTDEAWLATVEAIDEYLEKRATDQRLNATWGGVIDGILND